MHITPRVFSFFFFNDTATTEIYTLSLHDALPICAPPLTNDEGLIPARQGSKAEPRRLLQHRDRGPPRHRRDRKSTRLNSSHVRISYAVFCLKKKKNPTHTLLS